MASRFGACLMPKIIAFALLLFSQISFAADCNTSRLEFGPNHPNGFYGCFWECFGGVPANLGGCPSIGITNFCESFCAGADQCPVGNPIDITSGTKHESITDYSGGGQYPLEITRFYSSSKFDITGGIE